MHDQAGTPAEKRSRVGALIRSGRIAAGLSEDGGAILLSMSRSTLRDIEDGSRRVPSSRIAAAAEHFAIDRSVLIAAWVDAESSVALELPADAHPLARQVFVALLGAWDDLARASTPAARGTLAVIRWALCRPLPARS